MSWKDEIRKEVSVSDMHEYLQSELYKIRGGPHGLTKMDIKIKAQSSAVTSFAYLPRP